MQRVYGNTYPVKDILKSQCGARWSAPEKAWFVRQDMILVAMAIVERGMTANQFYNREESATATKEKYDVN